MTTTTEEVGAGGGGIKNPDQGKIKPATKPVPKKKGK